MIVWFASSFNFGYRNRKLGRATFYQAVTFCNPLNVVFLEKFSFNLTVKMTGYSDTTPLIVTLALGSSQACQCKRGSLYCTWDWDLENSWRAFSISSSASERAASTLRGSVSHRRAIFRERHRPDLLRGRARHRGHDFSVDARQNRVRSKNTDMSIKSKNRLRDPTL